MKKHEKKRMDRKELIRQKSEQFAELVQPFVDAWFGEDTKAYPDQINDIMLGHAQMTVFGQCNEELMAILEHVKSIGMEQVQKHPEKDVFATTLKTAYTSLSSAEQASLRNDYKYAIGHELSDVDFFILMVIIITNQLDPIMRSRMFIN
jgi:hypothetical protein